MSKLAKQIATEIMTGHGPGSKRTTVERIQMMKKQEDGTEKATGGRCFDSVVNAIDTVLQR